jgi:hypothetical protein
MGAWVVLLTCADSRTDLRAGTIPAPAHSAECWLIQSMNTLAACSLLSSCDAWRVM